MTADMSRHINESKEGAMNINELLLKDPEDLTIEEITELYIEVALREEKYQTDGSGKRLTGQLVRI